MSDSLLQAPCRSGATQPWVVSNLTLSHSGDTILTTHPVATNTARDLGSRFMVMSIWGSAASGGSYAAIAALTNIPATLCAVIFYELFLADSSRGAYYGVPWECSVGGS